MSTPELPNEKTVRVARQWGVVWLIIALALGAALASWELSQDTRGTTPIALALSGSEGPGETTVPSSRVGIVPTVDNRGLVLFGRYCDSCHPAGRQGIGSDLLSPQVRRKFTSVDKIAKLVRTGGFDMPPFRKELLSDGDLGAIGEYVVSLSPER